MILECWDLILLTSRPDSQQCYFEYNTIPCLPDPSAHSFGSLSRLILIIHSEFSEIETLRPDC